MVASNPQIELELQEGMALYDQGKVKEAEAIHHDILRRSPNNLRAIYFLGVMALETGRAGRAADFFRQAIAIDNGIKAFHNNLAHALQAQNQLEDAIASYDRAIALDPNYTDAYFNRGMALRIAGRFDAALAGFDKVLDLNPRDAEAHNQKALVLADLKRPDAALASYNNAILLNKDFAEAYSNRAVTLKNLRRFDEALASYDRAIELRPDVETTYSNRGIALHEMKRFEEALQNYDRAIQIKPDYAEAYSNRGAALYALNRFEEALRNYDRAIQIKPDYAEAHSNRAIALIEMRRFEEALRCCDRAIELNPDHAEANYNRGVALAEMKRFEEALPCFNRAARLRPDIDYARGSFLHTKMIMCDWSNYGSIVAELDERIARGGEVTTPFYMLALPSHPDRQKTAAVAWTQAKFAAGRSLDHASRIPKHDRIRVGYFSTDFRVHPVALSIAELIENHDRSRFELIAFSFGPDTDDDIRQRLRRAFDEFIDVQNMPDPDVAALARSHEIDIAIDLNGLTQGARTNVFALRAAPIQVNYLGYPGTMGADYIDYIMADATSIPVSSQQHYSEKTVHLPGSFFPNDSKRRISDREFQRSDLGLPAAGFVFCCFNNNYKISPYIFDSWARILARIEGSVLWLREDNEAATANLRHEAKVRNIDPDRLVFAPRMPHPDHLARHRAADLFLDTLPFNAHTTASDALWAGLPVLTWIGETFAGRVAASLLNAAGLPELITQSRDEYEAVACAIATDPARSASLKRKLVENGGKTPWFDTRRFARHVDSAYMAMYERYRAGLPANHILLQDESAGVIRR